MHALPPSLGTSHPKSHGGFTAIELMVVVAIVAVLAALAAPSFTPMIERWRVRDAAESLTSTLYLARSESIKRGGGVIVQANTGTDWGSGWHVYFDSNANGSQDTCDTSAMPNECDLQAVTAPNNVTINLPNTTGSISLDRWGMATHTGGASTPANLAFEVMPKNKTMSDSSSARMCFGTGGRIVRKNGSDTC